MSTSCVLIFCKALVKVERIDIQAPNIILASALPEVSDFKLFNTRWTLKPVEGGTKVLYEAELIPDFWVPPIIGPWALKRKFKHSADEIGMRIEFMHDNSLTLDQVAPLD